MNSKNRTSHLLVMIGVALCVGLLPISEADARERKIKIFGWGAKTGALKSLGLNSEAVLKAAVEYVNKKGVKTGDGERADIEIIEFADSACNAETGIAIAKRAAETDAIVGMGPTCSGVAQAIFGTLQKKAGDENDNGLQFPLLVDTAIKTDLAKMSEWAFRNVPNETQMYEVLANWLKDNYPDAKTFFGGYEFDQGHSSSTYLKIIEKKIEGVGIKLLGNTNWSLNSVDFNSHVARVAAANPDVVVVSAHPFTFCGFFKALAQKGVKPKALVGLTSSATETVTQNCGPEVEGVLIPSSFYPASPIGKRVINATKKYNGVVDLHSAAAWENIMMLKKVIQDNGIMGKPETLKEDREKFRAGMNKINKFPSLLGTLTRTPDGESLKPFFIQQVQDSEWIVVHNPGK